MWTGNDGLQPGGRLRAKGSRITETMREGGDRMGPGVSGLLPVFSSRRALPLGGGPVAALSWLPVAARNGQRACTISNGGAA